MSQDGAICPAKAQAPAFILRLSKDVKPRRTTEVIDPHLAEIAQAVAPGAHAGLVLDQADRHTT